MMRPRVSRKATKTLVSSTTRTLPGLCDQLERLLLAEVVFRSGSTYGLETLLAFSGLLLAAQLNQIVVLGDVHNGCYRAPSPFNQDVFSAIAHPGQYLSDAVTDFTCANG